MKAKPKAHATAGKQKRAARGAKRLGAVPQTQSSNSSGESSSIQASRAGQDDAAMQAAKENEREFARRWLFVLSDARNAILENFNETNPRRWRFQNGSFYSAVLRYFPEAEERLRLYWLLVLAPDADNLFGFTRARKRHVAELELMKFPAFDDDLAGNVFTSARLEYLADWMEAEDSWQWLIAFKRNKHAWQAQGVARHRAMAAGLLAGLPNEDYLSAEAFSLLWFGGVGFYGKPISGLIEDCELKSEDDWRAILVAAAALHPWTPGWFDVDCWMWHVFPVAKHNQWTANEAERVVLQKFDRRPGKHDENGFAQHFREIGLRFAGLRSRELVPLADFAVSLDTAADRRSRGMEIPLAALL